ncbi:hypothetical protein Tco_0153003 [Tanacetum coccineum]
MGRWSSEGNTFMSWGYVECLANQFRSDFEAFEVQLEDISFLWFLQVNHVPELLHVDEWYFSSVNECLYLKWLMLTEEELCPTNKRFPPNKSNVGTTYVGIVDDVNGLKKKKWATHALDNLVLGINTYKNGIFMPPDMIPQEIPEPKRTKMINKKLDELLKTRNNASMSRTRSKPAAETEDALEPLEPERRKWLEDTPFHKLLDMDRENNALIKKFVSMFNTEDHRIEDGEEEIKMPRRGQQTKILPKRIKDFVRRGQKGIFIDYVKTKLRESWDEDTLKRAYILLGGALFSCRFYATKGSFTTPLQCDKRGKKTRDKLVLAIEILSIYGDCSWDTSHVSSGFGQNFGWVKIVSPEIDEKRCMDEGETKYEANAVGKQNIRIGLR